MKSFPPFALFFVLSLVSISVNSQQITDYSYTAIPSGLKENANAVIRLNNTIVDVDATDQMHIKVERVITVLNKLGNKSVGASVGYDNNSKIVKLSAKIYNALGDEIKKINRNKFVDVSAVDGGSLYSDSRMKYLEYTPISYPYTIKLTYEVKTSSTGFLPNWNPVEGYLLSVEKNSYTVNLKSGKARVKEKNFNGYTIEKDITDSKIYYTIEHVAAIKPENNSPSLYTYKPKALVALNSFKTDGVNGYYTNWKEFGLWMNNSLLSGRANVDGATKIKLLALVKEVKDPIERAKIVYQFMQDKTRYISVQVGIGGIQPIPANEVDNVGYGDCKGLTNYTKALLDLVDVPSYYSHIEANSYEPISFEKDFASLEQGNHVILNIPNNGKDIWLECTSQTTPFGFLGDFTDDREALVITPEGGIIKRTTSYKNEQNLQKMKATIVLDAEGSLKANVNIESQGIQYDTKYTKETLSNDDLKQYYTSDLWYYNNNLSIDKVKLVNNKDQIVFKEALDISIKEYVSKASNQMLMRVNVFNVNRSIPKRYRSRKQPLKIRRGYKDIDEFTIVIPDTFKIDGILFEEKKIENKFGTYQISIKKIAENTITYKRTLLIKEGTYPKEDYTLYRAFRKTVAKYDNLRIAFRKE